MADEKNVETMAYSEKDGVGEAGLNDRGGVAVAVKYMGTDADMKDMTILGRKQVLRVRVRKHSDRSSMLAGC